MKEYKNKEELLEHACKIKRHIKRRWLNHNLLNPMLMLTILHNVNWREALWHLVGALAVIFFPITYLVLVGAWVFTTGKYCWEVYGFNKAVRQRIKEREAEGWKVSTIKSRRNTQADALARKCAPKEKEII